MRYFKIPIINDEPDISDNDIFDLLFFVGDGITCYGSLIKGNARETWEEINHDDFENLTHNDEGYEMFFAENVTQRINEQQKQLDLVAENQQMLMTLLIGDTENILSPESGV